MKTIGMIVAVEIQSVLERFGSQLKVNDSIRGFKVYECDMKDCHLVIADCGAGEIGAAAGTQMLISLFNVDMVVNFGVVGGLTEAMSKTATCIVEKIVHYDFDTSALDHVEVGRYLQYPDVYIPATPALLDKALAVYPDLPRVICASADKFVDDPQRKRELHELYGADICEMEAAGIALTCDRSGVPFLMIKIVSDGIEGGYQEFLATKDSAAAMCLEIISGVIDSI